MFFKIVAKIIIFEIHFLFYDDWDKILSLKKAKKIKQRCKFKIVRIERWLRFESVHPGPPSHFLPAGYHVSRAQIIFGVLAVSQSDHPGEFDSPPRQSFKSRAARGPVLYFAPARKPFRVSRRPFYKLLTFPCKREVFWNSY